LAHGRFITNDVLAAAAFFICISEFVNYLYSQSNKRLLWVGLVTGLAQLVKFSLVVLYPLYAVFAVIYLIRSDFTLTRLRASLTRIAVVAGISLTVVAIVYSHHTWNLPPAFQQEYNDFIFSKQFSRTAPPLVSATQDVPFLRGISWYMTGLSAQSMRVCIEQPVPDKLFMGKVVNSILPLSYYPILIATKEPVGFLGLLLLAVGTSLVASTKAISMRGRTVEAPSEARKAISEAPNAISEAPKFLLWCSLIVICVYMSIAMAGKVTLGIRHLAPVFPLAYMAASVALVHAITTAKERSRFVWICLVFALLSWGCLSSLSSFPGYLAYFNEFAGGKSGGAKIVNDSNYDWGTDLLRLRQYMDQNNVQRIYVRYIGSGSPQHYLGRRAKKLRHEQITPSGSLVAMSVRYTQRNVSILEERSRQADVTPAQLARLKWFSSLIPVGRAGDSIIIYRTP
jgi:hypothetical protein